MSGLAEWLTGQVDADEAAARANLDAGLYDSDPTVDGVGWPDYETYSGTPDLVLAQDYLDRFRPRRTLAEVAFKRALLAWGAGDGSEEAAVERGDISAEQYVTSEIDRVAVLRMLARVYEDPPGCQDAVSGH